MDFSKHVFKSPQLEAVVEDAVEFLLDTPPLELPPGDAFGGGGVYVQYYCGSYALYAPLAKANTGGPEVPIYVGKAVPHGWRTARSAENDANALQQRLSEHARSVTACGLGTKDFVCRVGILLGREADLISTVESALIRRFKPLWNTCIDGFGNHDPGSGRYNQASSEWDTLHPGRAWARRLRGAGSISGERRTQGGTISRRGISASLASQRPS